MTPARPIPSAGAVRDLMVTLILPGGPVGPVPAQAVARLTQVLIFSDPIIVPWVPLVARVIAPRVGSAIGTCSEPRRP